MKTALVFGHTSGLGFAITEVLIEKGYKVVGFARSVSTYKSDNLENAQVDLAKKEEVEKTISLIKEKHAKFDCFVYCSGTLTVHDIDKLDYNEMERLYRVNVFAPMILESNLVPLIKENEADIVNITSSVLVEFYSSFEEYSSAKAAIQKFTFDLQQELNETKSRVIEFCPGAFASNIYKNMTGKKVNRNEDAQVSAKEYANIIAYILELPKVMEVRRIYVDRKRW